MSVKFKLNPFTGKFDMVDGLNGTFADAWTTTGNPGPWPLIFGSDGSDTNNSKFLFDFESTPRLIEITSDSSTGTSAVQYDVPNFSIGTIGLTPTDNGFLNITPGSRTVNSVSNWADSIFSSTGDIDIDGLAMTDVGSLSISEPGINLNGGSILTAYTVKIEDAPTEGTDNYAFWVASGMSRFEDHVFMDQGIQTQNEIVNDITIKSGSTMWHPNLIIGSGVNIIIEAGATLVAA